MNDQENLIKVVRQHDEEIKKIKEKIDNMSKKPDILFKEEWIDGQDVMLALNISPRTLRTLRSSGVLAPTRLLKKYYYKVADIKQLLEQNYIRYHLTKDHD